MIYGYARVSTDAQDLGDQVAQLKAAGCGTIFREKMTTDRPQLKKLITKLSAGDVVVIPAVDRLSRDTTDLLVIARDMQRAGADPLGPTTQLRRHCARRRKLDRLPTSHAKLTVEDDDVDLGFRVNR